jgi:hypothetical protein
LTLGDALSAQLPVLLKEVRTFASIPAWLATMVDVWQVLDDGSHSASFVNLSPFDEMAKDGEVAPSFQPLCGVSRSFLRNRVTIPTFVSYWSASLGAACWSRSRQLYGASLRPFLPNPRPCRPSPPSRRVSLPHRKRDSVSWADDARAEGRSVPASLSGRQAEKRVQSHYSSDG